MGNRSHTRADDAPSRSAMFNALMAIGPATQSPGATLYDQLIGSWDVDVFDYKPDGTRRVSGGEWHFAWVLEGRAVQDVLIVPPRGARRLREAPGPGNRYGTTIRVYDPSRDAWNVTWFNPVAGIRGDLIGRRRGDSIVQEGQEPDGEMFRWTFRDITDDSFRWVGEISTNVGATWHLTQELAARRKAHRTGVRARRS